MSRQEILPRFCKNNAKFRFYNFSFAIISGKPPFKYDHIIRFNLNQHMLARLKKCRDTIKLGTTNELDLLDHPEFQLLKSYFDFENMKRGYSSTVQFALITGATYPEMKNGNEFLHKFCDFAVEKSNCFDSDKSQTKHELALLKAFHNQEIDRHFGYTGI